MARTIYLGSAPTLQHGAPRARGPRIKLGCVQPGESPAVFGDALRRLTDRASTSTSDGNRYWFSTQPTVTNLAQDRAETQRDEDVMEEIQRRLRDGPAARRLRAVSTSRPTTAATCPTSLRRGW